MDAGLTGQGESGKAMTLGLLDFEGAWVLEKRIVHADGQKVEFRGSARFNPDGIGQVYEERGLMKMEGKRPMSAQRRYLWRQVDRGLIELFFEDGRPFHVIDLNAPQDTHWCDPDTYKVKYTFDYWPEWIATWDVKGPEKGYKMVSTYRRPVDGD